MPCFRIDARHVARIGIAIGITVLHIEEQHEIESVLNGFSHGLLLSLLATSLS